MCHFAVSLLQPRSPPSGGLRVALRGAALALVLLAGCAPPDGPSARAATSSVLLPHAEGALPREAAPASAARPIANADLGRDFMELAFQLESGRTLPRMTRFEGPITVRTLGSLPAHALPDLERLIGRLNKEAGLDIRLTTDQSASITIEFLPRATLQAVVPNAACFVVPNVRGWAFYRGARQSALTDWAKLQTRSHVSIFIPSDIAPQEIRDCLHEEIAQAIGPLNDLYRLPQSVFNDDNFHAVLTDFDMLILRLYYAPELGGSPEPAYVAAQLPALLARLNPAGGEVQALAPALPTPRAFIDALERATDGQSSRAARRAAAQAALAIAQAQGWNDNRTGFALFVLGRLTLSEPESAAQALLEQAGALYRGLPNTDIQRAHVDMQLAAHALSQGQAARAEALARHALEAALRAENAALVATLQLIRAEALLLLGAPAQAQQARLDSEVWARYGFGSQAAAQRRAAEVGALAVAGARAN